MVKGLVETGSDLPVSGRISNQRVRQLVFLFGFHLCPVPNLWGAIFVNAARRDPIAPVTRQWADNSHRFRTEHRLILRTCGSADERTATTSRACQNLLVHPSN